MAIAVISVSILIWFALGRRESLIVLLAIPATLALTLAVFYFDGYTLNRITLFALIFSIGILVDDAIVVVENIARHARMPENRGVDLAEIAVRAVDEVGNPTILATMTVIAAILPMAFVGGLMGPYMRPIPIGATAAMVFSLLVAFIVTPWATRPAVEARATAAHDEREGMLTRVYRRFMGTLLRVAQLRAVFLAGVVVLLVAAMAPGRDQVRQASRCCRSTTRASCRSSSTCPRARRSSRPTVPPRRSPTRSARSPRSSNYQTYVGTSGPYNFNGLVRHYFLRRGPNVADIQVNLVGKDERSAQSHAIAKPDPRRRSRRSPRSSARGSRSRRCRPDRRCSRRWSPRSTARPTSVRSRSRARSAI